MCLAIYLKAAFFVEISICSVHESYLQKSESNHVNSVLIPKCLFHMWEIKFLILNVRVGQWLGAVRGPSCSFPSSSSSSSLYVLNSGGVGE